jgi:hypothetical protein
MRDATATGGSWVSLPSNLTNGILQTTISSDVLVSGGGDFGIVRATNRVSSGKQSTMSLWILTIAATVLLL